MNKYIIDFIIGKDEAIYSEETWADYPTAAIRFALNKLQSKYPEFKDKKITVVDIKENKSI